MTIVQCYVCRGPLDTITDEPHTYHEEGCPRRDDVPHSDMTEPCYQLTNCGVDVHAECCPTCTGQAFSGGDECPAGGPHTWAEMEDHAGRTGVGCEECGATMPRAQ